jgi:hypothetical protein
MAYTIVKPQLVRIIRRDERKQRRLKEQRRLPND